MNLVELIAVMSLNENGKGAIEMAFKGITDFLSVVCKPCCEEFGLMIKDKVREWRLRNIIRVIEKSQNKLSFDGQQLNLRANARVALSIMEECSKVDDEELQDLWAGLFASSCTVDGRDDSNMIFVDLIRRMSTVEARILQYACEQCGKKMYPNKLIVASDISISFKELTSIAKTSDIYRLDAEMDHMRSIMLMNHNNLIQRGGGFYVDDNDLSAVITPSPLGLSLYFKTHAINCSPREFWKASLED